MVEKIQISYFQSLLGQGKYHVSEVLFQCETLLHSTFSKQGSDLFLSIPPKLPFQRVCHYFCKIAQIFGPHQTTLFGWSYKTLGGFQLLDLIITELKSHMTYIILCLSLGTIHSRRRQIFTIFDPYPPTIGIPAKCLWRGFLILMYCDLLTISTWEHPSPPPKTCWRLVMDSPTISVKSKYLFRKILLKYYKNLDKQFSKSKPFVQETYLCNKN